MSKRDPRVDAYIAKSPEFAKPILEHIREVVHSACPECEEDIKWGNPSFVYKGLLGGMAAFKQHCMFGFWKGSLVVADKGQSLEAAGSFGRITRVSDLPSKKVLAGYVKQAMKLNEEGTSVPRATKAPKKPVSTPTDLSAALAKNRKAAATYEKFSPSHRRDYVEWITEARTEETRKRRLAQAVEWMAEGKGRNWKYEKA
jgi:uncharacterized protein YdeI (YjbR/CyaY-like superfamily)